MNDDQLDEVLTEAARDYNAPGDVPRDAMWARVAEARWQRKVAPPARSRVWLWTSAGIAAALLIATGISIGRRLERSLPLAGSTVASRDTISRLDSAGPDKTLAYQLVVLQHLAGTEAMITSFRASARSGEADAQVGKWARELLGTTRLLEASPAAVDPVMKRLLEDLELVIVQIVQYTSRGTNDPEELDLIEQSIKRRGVLTKLRSTLPGQAGLPGTRG
jgi:hypothetical protein